MEIRGGDDVELESRGGGDADVGRRVRVGAVDERETESGGDRSESRAGDDAGAGKRIEAGLERLAEEVRELSLGSEVPRVEGPPTPVEFLRDFVLPSRPCIITGALRHWPALRKWSNAYLRAALQDRPVSVHFTPDGRADSVVNARRMLADHACPVVAPSSDPPSAKSQIPAGGRSRQDRPADFYFVRAHVEKLPFCEALRVITEGGEGDGGGGVAYAQEQNGCFLSEYGPLTGDAEDHIPWATEALGARPEAVNLWMGNERAVTSFHKDHYENLYAVVAGEKHFTLLPPVEVPRMYVRRYPAAQFVRAEGGGFAIAPDEGEAAAVPWASVDPDLDGPAERARFPKYFRDPPPFRCTVRAGELLFLPSTWFHRVAQSPDAEGRAIALNFWYDMQFDLKFAYFNLLESLL